MKKQINEPDYIGGHGALTKEEEEALTKYFADKKAKGSKRKTLVRKTRSKRLTYSNRP